MGRTRRPAEVVSGRELSSGSAYGVRAAPAIKTPDCCRNVRRSIFDSCPQTIDCTQNHLHKFEILIAYSVQASTCCKFAADVDWVPRGVEGPIAIASVCPSNQTRKHDCSAPHRRC